MILRIYAIYDEKAKAYLTPFFLPETAMALRSFKDCVNDKNHQFSQNPADYTLYELGTFDNVAGRIDEEQKAQVAQGVAVIQRQPTDSEQMDLLDIIERLDWLETICKDKL